MSELRQALEAAIFEDPEDRAAHAAYADYLAEQGDPRGEFIQVQLAILDPNRGPADRETLRLREQELLTQHATTWLGELGRALEDDSDEEEEPARGELYTFSRGWLDRLTMRWLNEATAQALGTVPQARLLRELTIEADNYLRTKKDRPEWNEAEERYRHASDLLVHSPNLQQVRVFRVGEAVEDEGEDCEYYDSYCDCPNIPQLVANMPRLEELYLFAKRYNPIPLFSASLGPQLRILQIYHLEERYPLELLATNPHLGNLTHLLLHPHGYADVDDPFIDLRGVRALVRSPHLRSLAHLRIRLCPMGDAGCEELVASGILKQLKTLDLRHGAITDAGARLLAGSSDLRNLKLLDINRNGLTAEGIAVLEATGVPLRARNQLSAGELERHDYLEEGDFE